MSTPPWLTIPNAISVARLLLVPLFIWLVAIDEIGWAGVTLAVIGTTDWIDGYLARKLDQVSEEESERPLTSQERILFGPTQPLARNPKN